jgi:hypothetical protein
MSNDKVTTTRGRLNLFREGNRIYFVGKDKRDPQVAAMRKVAAEDMRYFHRKWLNAKQS